MRHFSSILAVSFCLLTQPVSAAEKDPVLTARQELAFFFRPGYFDSIPKNPALLATTMVYRDKELTELAATLSPEESLSIDRLDINRELTPVFRLKNGYYLPASQLLIVDDQILAQKSVTKTLWLKKNPVLYDKPYIKGAKTVQTDVTAYQAVKVVEEALTQAGVFYRIEGKGWVAEEATYDGAMKALQALLLNKYKKDNLSIYVKRIDDGEVAELNAYKVMYGASVTKLATIYKVQEELNKGTVALTDKFKYTKEVNAFSGHYDPDGTGGISKTPDDEDYSLEELLKALIRNSDNVASNMLAYYVADKLGTDFQQELKTLLGEEWDMVNRRLSARLAGEFMGLLYEQKGQVLELMKETSFDDTRISKDISVPVAHKTGDADEFRHDVAIVYADRPFILSIFTEHATYEDITAIANDVYNLLK